MPRCQSNSFSHSSFLSSSPVLTESPFTSLLHSASHYMKKDLASFTLNTYNFTWRTFASPVLACLIPSLLLLLVHLFVTAKMSKNLNPPYIWNLTTGIQSGAICHDPGFLSWFSNPSIKLLLKGIAKVCPSVPDCRQPVTLSILHKMLSCLCKGMFRPYIDSLLSSY